MSHTDRTLHDPGTARLAGIPRLMARALRSPRFACRCVFLLRLLVLLALRCPVPDRWLDSEEGEAEEPCSEPSYGAAQWRSCEQCCCCCCCFRFRYWPCCYCCCCCCCCNCCCNCCCCCCQFTAASTTAATVLLLLLLLLLRLSLLLLLLMLLLLLSLNCCCRFRYRLCCYCCSYCCPINVALMRPIC